MLYVCPYIFVYPAGHLVFVPKKIFMAIKTINHINLLIVVKTLDSVKSRGLVAVGNTRVQRESVRMKNKTMLPPSYPWCSQYEIRPCCPPSYPWCSQYEIRPCCPPPNYPWCSQCGTEEMCQSVCELKLSIMTCWSHCRMEVS